jgi:predicted RNA-binding Zn-ribbon protein involved in translation (DUF1610 family)
VGHAPHRGASSTRGTELDIADIFRRHGEAASARYGFSAAQRHVLQRIIACRTEALGGHMEKCPDCDFKRPSYNSCRDRHCPKCQATRQAQWNALRQERMLPVGHYHIVFTLPGLLRPLAYRLPRFVYEQLFKAASATLTAFGNDPRWLGAQLGYTAVLHTWTRELQLHPHLHCVVTAGGLSRDQSAWVKPTHAKVLFPVRALAKVFRGKFLAALERLGADERAVANLVDDKVFRRLLDRLHRTKWVVFSKRPFASSDHLFSYLGRYTHRVAISNHRLIAVDDDTIHFATKDGKSTRLPPVEFIKRFLDHVLPPGLTKIRHYGLYAGSNVETRLQLAHALLAPLSPPAPPPPPEPSAAATSDTTDTTPDTTDLLTRLFGPNFLRCPNCGKANLRRVETLPATTRARGPP